MRRALDAVLHGAEAVPDPVGSGTSRFLPNPGLAGEGAGAPFDTAGVDSGAAGLAGAVRPDRADPTGTWETLIRFEEARWLRYGHPCVAAQLEVVGGQDVTARLGDEAGARLRAGLEQLLSTTTRASDRYEPRDGWRLVALLPETDMAGATVALERLQAAFSALMGPALTVRIAFGLAAPAPTGTLSVAFHQAHQLLVSQRRRERSGSPRSEDAARVHGGAIEAAQRHQARSGDSEVSRPTPLDAGGARPRDPGDRLDALTRLLKGGYISEAEYLTKRTEVLDRL